MTTPDRRGTAEKGAFMHDVLLAFGLTLIAGLSTGVGSLIALLARRTSRRFLSVSLGFSAGVMIYVSMVEILATAREALAGAFEPWHFACNDEGDSNLCYLRIVPESGFFHKDGTGYRVDFINGTAAEFPFTAQVEMALQPRANIPVF